MSIACPCLPIGGDRGGCIGGGGMAGHGPGGGGRLGENDSQKQGGVGPSGRAFWCRAIVN